ncbi:hypothetical protein SLE2022_161790 [Rubroshorea leprosula]
MLRVESRGDEFSSLGFLSGRGVPSFLLSSYAYLPLRSVLHLRQLSCFGNFSPRDHKVATYSDLHLWLIFEGCNEGILSVDWVSPIQRVGTSFLAHLLEWDLGEGRIRQR